MKILLFALVFTVACFIGHFPFFIGHGGTRGALALSVKLKMVNDTQPLPWTRSREILTAGKQAEPGYALIELDAQVFDHSRPDLGDLRIRTEEGEEIPSLLLIDDPNPPLKLLRATIDPQPNDSQLRASVWILDLGARHLPSSRIECAFDSNNFQRRVRIEGGNDRQDWAELGGGEILDVNIGRVKRRQLRLDYPETRSRYLRLKIFNYDNQPLTLTEARVYGRPYRLLFAFQPEKRYRLWYGNSAATSPRYDLEQLRHFIRTATLPTFALSEERDYTESGSPRTVEPQTERPRIWLWATLAVAALIIGVLIFRLAKLTAG